MNLYIRYFNYEALATNMDDVVNFISTIEEIHMDDNAYDRIAKFMDSDNSYPFRLKVSYSNYILFLKTEARNLEEFKEWEQNRSQVNHMSMAERKRLIMEQLEQKQEGWYDASIMFKRAVVIPESGKCQYFDNTFRAKVKAESAVDCYNQMIEHLQNRQDIDPRSQFPSVKSDNFIHVFLGSEA